MASRSFRDLLKLRAGLDQLGRDSRQPPCHAVPYAQLFRSDDDPVEVRGAGVTFELTPDCSAIAGITSRVVPGFLPAPGAVKDFEALACAKRAFRLARSADGQLVPGRLRRFGVRNWGDHVVWVVPISASPGMSGTTDVLVDTATCEAVNAKDLLVSPQWPTDAG